MALSRHRVEPRKLEGAFDPFEDPATSALLSQLCNAFLIAVSVLMIPAIWGSIARSGELGWQPGFMSKHVALGWQPVMSLQVALGLAMGAVTLLRRRLSFQVRAWFSVSWIATVAISGVHSFGLMGASISWVPFSGVMAAILLGRRMGILVLLVTVLLATLSGLTAEFSGLPEDLNSIQYMRSNAPWMGLLFAWLVLGGSVIFSVGILHTHFIENLDKSKNQTKALEASQRDYREMFENMVDTVYRADQDGRIRSISPSIVNMLGFEPHEVQGKTLADYYVDSAQRDRLVSELAACDGDVRDFQAQMYNRDGQPQWISTNTRFWKDIDGNLLGIEGVARNITAQKSSEEALRRAQKMQALGHLTGGIAHDFNNILGIIMGNADMIEEEAVAASAASCQNAEEILKAAEQGAALTRRLLAFSRPQTMTAEPTAADVVIRDLEGMLRRTLGATVTLLMDLKAENTNVLLDAHQLESAVLNLVINARDAMPDGGELRVATRKITLTSNETVTLTGLEPGDHLRVTVSDTGTGMDEETARNAFEPFFTTKPLGTGNGLGLSMVYGFVANSAGHASIDTKPGEGASIAMLFPCSNEEARSPLNPKPVENQARVKGRILLVEDAAALRELGTKLLQAHGYEVVAAENGPAALEILRRDSEISLLFSDVVLPGGMDGFEIAREATRIRSDLKVLFTSGYALKIPPESDPLSKVPVVSKPYRRAQLLSKVDEVLSGSRAGKKAQFYDPVEDR